MKKNKYMVFFVVLSIGFILIQEQTQFYLDNFSTMYPSIMIFSNDENTCEEVLKYLIQEKDESISVWTGKATAKSNLLTQITFFTSDDADSHLINESQLKSGLYRSLFSGNKEILYSDISEVNQIDTYAVIHFIGNPKKISTLIDKTNENFKSDYVLNPAKDEMHLEYKISIIWTFIGSILIMLTLYDVLFQKKESLIRAIHGEKIFKIVCKNMLLDTGVILIILSLLFISSKAIYNSFLFPKTSFYCLITIIFINNLLYLSLYKYNLKKDLSLSLGTKKLIAYSYALKILTTSITLILLFQGLTFLSQNISLIKQKQFYSDFANRSFVDVQLDEFSKGDIFSALQNTSKVQNSIFTNEYDSATPILLYKHSEIYDTPVVLANNFSKDYLTKNFMEINEKDDIIVFIPKKLKNNNIVLSQIDKYTSCNNFNYKIINYSDNRIINVISCNFLNDNLYKSNPVLFYFNFDKSSWDVFLENNPDFLLSIFPSIAFNFDANGLDDLLFNYNFNIQEVYLTNILEQYNQQLSISIYSMIVYIIFCVLVIYFDFSIAKFIIMMEYKLRGKELAIKKVNGYSTFQLNKKMLIYYVIVYLLGVAGALLIVNTEGIAVEFKCVIFALIVTFVLETIIAIKLISKMYKANIQEIIKGGLL